MIPVSRPLMRILRYALKNIIRNTFLSFSTVITLGLIAFFIFVLFLVQYGADRLIDSVNDRITISVNLREGYDSANSDVIALMAAIRAVPGAEIEYVSKEEAFDILSERYPDLASVVESEDDNPLPSSIIVKNISLDRYDALDSAVSKYRGIVMYDSDASRESLVDYRSQYKKIREFITLISTVKYGIYAVIVCFLFGIFVIIYTIIGNFVFFYREEIQITRLVGGDAYFLYGPFVAQGAIYSLLSAIASAGIFLILLQFVRFSFFMNSVQFAGQFLSAYAWYLIAVIIMIVAV
ncbi:MAG TPA: permease-like cell division protein FtsX [bacterium]|nr:permease-like cell division protein FtsX [bacterium]